jgi:hypothetical protein
MPSDVKRLSILFDSGYVAFRVGGPTVLLILDWRYVGRCLCVLAMLTMPLGFDDRIYLKYETMPDRAVLPLTSLIGSLLTCNLLLSHYKVYCMSSFLSSKPKVLYLTDVFQHMASHVQSLVIFLSPVGDGVFIGLLALNSLVRPRLPQVRAFYFFHSYAVVEYQSSLMEWAGQFAVSIIYRYICEHISRSSVGSLTSCSG